MKREIQFLMIGLLACALFSCQQPQEPVGTGTVALNLVFPPDSSAALGQGKSPARTINQEFDRVSCTVYRNGSTVWGPNDLVHVGDNFEASIELEIGSGYGIEAYAYIDSVIRYSGWSTIFSIEGGKTKIISVILVSDNFVSGEVYGQWTLANSPYYVTSEIIIPINQTLTIEPGVQILFMGHFKLIVNGILEAMGTEQDSILFTAAGADTSLGWHGIRFVAAQDSSHLSHCIIIDGKANGSGNDSFGGAITCEGSNPVISNCLFRNNFASQSGGCIASHYNSNPRIENCLFAFNSAGWSGGGLYCYLSNLSLTNCLLIANYATEGSAIACNNSIPNIINNTLSGNGSNSTIRLHDNANANIINCIVWGNEGNSIDLSSSTPIVTFSDIEGGWPGNINADPVFITGSNGDYYLSQTGTGQTQQSPCINAGDPSSAMITGTTRTDGVQDAGIVDIGYHYPN